MLDLGEYKGKKIKNVVKGDVSLDKTTDSEEGSAEGQIREAACEVKERLKDEVQDVRLSGRLTDSASCLWRTRAARPADGEVAQVHGTGCP